MSEEKSKRCRCKPDGDAFLYRCRHGNVWLEGVLSCSVPPDRSALSIIGVMSAPVGRTSRTSRRSAGKAERMA